MTEHSTEPTAEPAYNPWRELRAIGHEGPEGVIFGQRDDLPSGDAWWVPSQRTVLMKRGLLQVKRRCRLAHELGHRHLGHTGQCIYGDSVRIGDRHERDADEWAARQLITLEALAEALKWSDDPDEVADDLWVTRTILEVRLARMYGSERRTVGVLLRGGRDEADDGIRGGRGRHAGGDELRQRRHRRRRDQGSGSDDQQR